MPQQVSTVSTQAPQCSTASCRSPVSVVRGPARRTHHQLIMIVSTDQQAFSVTILVKAEEEETVKQVKQEEEEVEMVEARGHEGLVLEGLAGLRDQGLLLDTRLWTEGQSFQVDQLFFSLQCNVPICLDC